MVDLLCARGGGGVPNLGSLVLIFMLCLMNKLIEPSGASIRKTIIKRPLKYLND